tara:strand:+ start:401 stop:1018 length:618 start_codon:yes stop_codon:yes gene_type:complete
VYPQEINSLPSTRCPRCHLLKIACLCSKIPALESFAVFFLLVHQRELGKGSNTGHLVLNAFEDAQYELWARVDPPENLMALLNSPAYQGYLLFTAEEGAAPVAFASVKAGVRPVYILIDATWQQARKMLRQSPYLQNLPRLSLSGASKSRYRLRRNQLDVGLSTCEAAIGLLQQSGEKGNAQALNQYFSDFMCHYDASMSGHGVD